MVPSLTSILIGVLTLSATRLFVQTTNEGQELFVVERTERDVECASCEKDIGDSVTSGVNSSLKSADINHTIKHNRGELTACTGIYV